MEIKTLNKWADLLLDLGKRNNLINFRNTKMGTAEIVAPALSTIFDQVDNAVEFEVYDPKLEEDDDDFEFAEDGIPDNSQNPNYKYSDKPRYSKEQYRSMYERKLKRGQVLVYNSDCKPIQALKNISKKGRTAIEETGVNILYLAFGFINWTEEEGSHYVMKAPVLLVPVSIENESALEPYRIRVSDDDIIVNPTFSYKLHNEFNITLPEPEEDEEIDAYFDRIEEMLSKIKWSVSRECKLGIFSFMKINMYQDLKDNAEKIAESDNVRALLGTSEISVKEGFAAPEHGSASELMELHNVVDADSSQSEAIEMAREGKSFVLQGPPGTGKSQTITNIIAECLYDGKTVLFVSEKLAALNVVYDKLKKAELNEFCLELHSHKASKKQVIDNLTRTLKAPRSALSARAQRELDIKKRAQLKLDTYAEELHRVRPVINKTLYALYGEMSACRKAPDVEFVIKDITHKGEEYIEAAVSALEKYTEYIPAIGYDYRKSRWFGYDSADLSYEAKMELKADIQSVIKLFECLIKLFSDFEDKYGVRLDSLEQIKRYSKLFAAVRDTEYITPALLISEKAEEALRTAQALAPQARAILAADTYLRTRYDDDIHNIDGITVYKQLSRQFTGVFSRLFDKEYRNIIKQIRLCSKTGKRVKYKNALEDMKVLSDRQECMMEYNRIEKGATYFGSGYKGIETDFDALAEELKRIIGIAYLNLEYGNMATLSADAFELAKKHFGSIYDSLSKALETCGDADIRLRGQFDLAVFDIDNAPLAHVAEKCKGCASEFYQVDNWWQFTRLLKDIDKLGLKKFLDDAIDCKMPPEMIPLAYKKAFYMQWIDAIWHETPVMLELSRIPHDEAVKLFKEKDELNFEINKAMIREAVSAKRPGLDMVAQGSAISILTRESEKKRKQKSIRQLLLEIGELALTLKPCFLMSPLSVSTFLSPEIKFDVVIFDEASQIFPQDAIGAIYRGKQLIVVGDSKQMPPSNFFNASADMDDEDEAEDIADYESILDLCSTSFPQLRLKWHYRSRFESLISFSNKNFYENDLITFPSSRNDTRGIGVDYYYVDGTFDRLTKTNLAEAERVVELVFENMQKYPERSLGVVAFSVSQQTLIEKLISKRRLKDRSKEEFFKSDRAEPFFVKNLETVQGDERDTIIFSIAYAKDTKGKLYHNFGPVNRVGGERRLNVAVTRAKFNVQLVTSMHYTDIDLTRTQSVGARLLREYLDYAENGMIALERSSSTSAFGALDFEFEAEVCEFLREIGYDIDTQVGCSSFKIDLALKQPHTSNYLLAIECDGESYHSSKTTRDRDRLRQAILENMGWKFYRIWSTDWFRNKKTEKERLLSAVVCALQNARIPKEEDDGAEDDFEQKAESKHFEFPKYEKVSVEDIQAEHNNHALKIIRAVLEVEAPVCEEWMLKRVAHLYGKGKITAAVRSEFDKSLRASANYKIERRDGFLYLLDREIPMLRVPADGEIREIKHIAIEELALGIMELLKQNISADKTGLFRLLAQHLGFSRMSGVIHARFERALETLKDKIDIDGDNISVK